MRRRWRAFPLEVLKPGATYIIGACDPRMQKKMFRDAFEKAGISFEEHVLALDLRSMPTEQALEKVKAAFARASQRDRADAK